MIVNLRDCELESYEEGPEGHRFRLRALGAEAGAAATGLSVYELDPGESTWPYHFELTTEEWLFVVEGELTLRTPEGEQALRAGDVACFPVGAAGAHAVRNDGTAVARFAMPSVNASKGSGGTVYPDQGTFQITTPGFRHRGRLGEHLDYWDAG